MSTVLTRNLQLQNIVTGTQPTTWWNTENFDRTLVDQAICAVSSWPVTVNFTITVQSGTPAATARVWIFTGTPPATVTVTFAPNSSQNWAFAINQTTETLIFEQGLGTTISMPTNTSGILIFDGAGAGANVTQLLFNNARGPGTLAAPSYTFVGLPDVGLYVPGIHTLGIAANDVEMAQFKSSGTMSGQPAGLNTWGVFQ